jgi:hypothetical protein
MSKFDFTKSRVTRALGASAAAAAAVTGAGMVGNTPEAQAEIVWSGIVNLNIPSTTNGLYLNVVTGANNLPGSTGGSTVPGWDVNPWSSSTLNFFNPSNPTGGVYVRTDPAVAGVSNLTPGFTVGGSSLYSSGVAQTTGSNPFVLNSSNNLVGFRFQNEANANQVHYGWMRISLSGTLAVQPRALVEYAYENVAGQSIQAGAVPEPGTLGLLAMGAAGLVVSRRRRTA